MAITIAKITPKKGISYKKKKKANKAIKKEFSGEKDKVIEIKPKKEKAESPISSEYNPTIDEEIAERKTRAPQLGDWDYDKKMKAWKSLTDEMKKKKNK